MRRPIGEWEVARKTIHADRYFRRRQDEYRLGLPAEPILIPIGRIVMANEPGPTLTGAAFEFASAGYVPMPEPDKKSNDDDAIGSDSASLREAAEQRAGLPDEIVARGYFDGNGEPAAANEAITLERASRDYAGVTSAEKLVAENETAKALAARVHVFALLRRKWHGSHGIPGYVDEKPDSVDFGRIDDCCRADRTRTMGGVIVWKVSLHGDTTGEPRKRHVSAEMWLSNCGVGFDEDSTTNAEPAR
jgi:hypothetical protein